MSDFGTLFATADAYGTRISAKHDLLYRPALAAFPALPGTREEFRLALGRFIRHLNWDYESYFSKDAESDIYFAEQSVLSFVGRQSGPWANSYEMYEDAKSGCNGGLRAILDAAFKDTRQRACESARSVKINQFLSTFAKLDDEQQTEVARAYWEGFGQFYPATSVYRHTELLVIDFAKVLQAHSTVFAPLRESIRASEQQLTANRVALS